MATISTHNGSTLSLGHNRREKKIVSKEEHIIQNGEHEEWLSTYQNKSMKEIYEDIFKSSVDEYNSRQKRNDRKINSYYEQIQQDKRKHLAYEMIVGVYDKSIDEQTKKLILQDFAKGWFERNPNLKMIGCSYHNDEQGNQGGHIHIDYIPIAQCNRGMKVQNSLSRALSQQGIESGTSIHETSQILWEKRENKVLEELCNQRGIEIQHSDFYKGHESTSSYKQRQILKDNRELLEDNKALKDVYNSNLKVINKQKEAFNKNNEYINIQKQKINNNNKIIQEQANDYLKGFLKDCTNSNELSREDKKRILENNGFEL